MENSNKKVTNKERYAGKKHEVSLWIDLEDYERLCKHAKEDDRRPGQWIKRLIHREVERLQDESVNERLGTSEKLRNHLDAVGLLPSGYQEQEDTIEAMLDDSFKKTDRK